MLIQGLIIASAKSRTVDEVTHHLQGGYKYLTTGKWGYGVDNPPLSSTLAAIPFLFIRDKSSFDDFNKGAPVDYIQGYDTFPRKVLILGRIVPILFMVLLGLSVFLWARELYGVKAGLLALALVSFSPNLLAFGSIATADIGGVLFGFLAMYTFWRYTSKPTKKRLLMAALFFGLAQAAKLLSVFLIPFFILYALIIYFSRDFEANFFPNLKSKKLKKASDLFLSLAAIFLAGMLIINIAYLFDGSFTPLKQYDKDKFLSSSFKKMHDNKLINWIPIPLPKPYVIGHDISQWNANDQVRGFFFMGEVGERFRSYYLVHILIKTPIALFVLLILGFLYFRKITYPEIYMLLYIIIIIALLSLFSKLLVGYRHVLSIYPLMIILSSRILKDGIPKNRIITIAVALCTGWYILSSLYVFPNHLAYFNEFIGGPKNGYKYTIDSNLDWEQDLYLVGDYVKGRESEFVIDPGCVAFTGKAIIPANSLQFQKWVCYQWLKQNFEPIDYIGYSWLVYDVKGVWQQTDNGYIFTKTS